MKPTSLETYEDEVERLAGTPAAELESRAAELLTERMRMHARINEINAERELVLAALDLQTKRAGAPRASNTDTRP